MMLSTHVIVGLTLSTLLFIPASWVVIGSILPDLDYLVGFEHRTIMHSLLFCTTGFIVYKFFGKHNGLAYTIGLLSHLSLDLITPMGVQLLYPLQVFFSFNLVKSLDNWYNLFIMLICLVFIINRKSIQESLINLKKGVVLKGTAVFFSSLMILSLFFPVSNCSYSISLIDLINNPAFSEKEVLVNGSICSDVDSYTSKSGNNYQVFRLCSDNSSILVFKGDWVLENNLSKGDLVSLCALYTEQYEEPELYYVKKVIKQ